MVETLLTALTSYIGTTSDYFVVLLLLFAQFRTQPQRQAIMWGAYLGNALLVFVAVAIALLLKRVPEEWVLGLLGFVPIAMGLQKFFSSKDEGEEVAEKLARLDKRKIVMTVIGLTAVTCGADNLALYIPYFTMANFAYLPAILVIFIIVLTVVIYLAKKFTDFAPVHRLVNKYGDWIQLIIYVLLGSYVLFDAGTIQHLLSLL